METFSALPEMILLPTMDRRAAADSAWVAALVVAALDLALVAAAEADWALVAEKVVTAGTTVVST